MSLRAFAAVSMFWIVLVGCGGRAPTPASAADTLGQSASAVVTPSSLSGETASSPTPVDSVAKPSLVESIPAIVARAFPKAAAIRHAADPFPHLVVLGSGQRVLGYEVFSDSTGTTARGYSGPVPLQVFFDRLGKPVRIYILDNSETTAYLDIIYRAGLLEALLQMDPVKPDSVDAVTLATSTSRAIIDGVAKLAARVATEVASTAGETR